MTDFIREVDEDLRQDRFKHFLNRYWYVVALLVVLILGGVGAWKATDYLRTQKAEAAGGQYLASLDLARDGKSDEALAALKQVETDGTPGYRMLARFRLAGETGAKDPIAAAKQFDDLAADPAIDPALQAIARLRAGLLLLDTLPYAALKTRLDPLADANSPVRNAAREILAIGGLKANQPDDAGRYLTAIEADATATVNLRQRAEVLLGVVRTAADVAGGAASAPTPAPSPIPPAAESVASPPVAAPTPAEPPADSPAK